MKVRDGQVANRPFYAAIGVDLAGHKDVLGLWAGDGAGESAKFWFAVLTDLRNRGVTDTFFLICDGLKGLPDVVGEVWPATIVQACTVHLIRNSFRYVPRQHWDALRRDLKPIYTAPTAAAAEAALEALADRWGSRYPALIRLWQSCWNEFIPFLDYDTEIRRVLCSTNAIVIWSPPGGVLDVRHEAFRSQVLRGGRDYLQSSRRQEPAEGRCRLRSSPGTWCTTSSCDSSTWWFRRSVPPGCPPVLLMACGRRGIC
ncbi:hypothetical protein MINTM008_09910 [Mycobacterium intracellulare]|uniref:Mutator family transposase n=5 Tax=Mycobacterium TaxID=1763 RepID=A0A7I7Z0K2_9MYCO|nr:hypothetical protein AWC08_27925 [Mycobacterium gordonae]ORW02691.1 hypothetical protein AWC13_03945 [Mycobacterium kubicae]BBN46503.1 hypothetical protein JPH1_09780 [Mycobacterium avium subsp. hominissuis]BBZ47606.1 hypothetical protein MPRM_48870 [Mycobacterium parmense]BCO45062.1 hypothetical protein MINTM002_07360 [Mycobacterium intracellulare]